MASIIDFENHLPILYFQPKNGSFFWRLKHDHYIIKAGDAEKVSDYKFLGTLFCYLHVVQNGNCEAGNFSCFET